MRARSEPEVFTLYDVVRRVKGMSWTDEEGSSARGRAPHGLAVTPRAWHASWWLSSTVQSVGLERGRGGGRCARGLAHCGRFGQTPSRAGPTPAKANNKPN